MIAVSTSANQALLTAGPAASIARGTSCAQRSLIASDLDKSMLKPVIGMVSNAWIPKLSISQRLLQDFLKQVRGMYRDAICAASAWALSIFTASADCYTHCNTAIWFKAVPHGE